jgi:hypothetical protein
MRLQVARKREQREHLIAGKVGKIDKALHDRRIASLLRL